MMFNRVISIFSKADWLIRDTANIPHIVSFDDQNSCLSSGTKLFQINQHGTIVFSVQLSVAL